MQREREIVSTGERRHDDYNKIINAEAKLPLISAQNWWINMISRRWFIARYREIKVFNVGDKVVRDKCKPHSIPVSSEYLCRTKDDKLEQSKWDLSICACPW